jgi:hypothetical protein
MPHAGTHIEQPKLVAQADRFRLSRAALTQTILVAHPDEIMILIKERKAYFSSKMRMSLLFTETGQRMTYAPGPDTLLGRGPFEPEQPHFDLGPFGALKKGVSRRHARLTRSGITLMIEDLGALNGTFLNGERLSRRRLNVLCDGDELQLGLLTIKLRFEKM